MKGAWEQEKRPGTEVMENDVAVPSYELLLACRDEDAGLSVYIYQSFSRYLYPISHQNNFSVATY